MRPRPIAPPSGNYAWIQLWNWPIRAMHWLAALSILTLVVTGLYIGRPYFLTSGDTSSHFLMGWMRFLHFAAAGLLVATGVIRIYWLFAGNRFERWRALFPVTRKDWKNLVRQLKFYLLIQPEKAPHYLGHNPLQQFSFTGLYLIALLSVLTGFALYGQSNPAGLFYRLFNWVGWFGGMYTVRFVHHILTWLYLIFLPIHIYLAVRAELLERTAVISSVISGGRFVPTDVHWEDGPLGDSESATTQPVEDHAHV
jgi:Ni/Fe-hydrogenase 1 B-type cytochrome subunit